MCVFLVCVVSFCLLLKGGGGGGGLIKNEY